MSLSMKDVIKVGARKLLLENEREREWLLKILNETPSKKSSSGLRKLVRRNIKKLHWTQTPAGRERMRQAMLKRHKENK